MSDANSEYILSTSYPWAEIKPSGVSSVEFHSPPTCYFISKQVTSATSPKCLNVTSPDGPAPIIQTDGLNSINLT